MTTLKVTTVNVWIKVYLEFGLLYYTGASQSILRHCLKSTACCRLTDFSCLNNLYAVDLNPLSCKNQWCDGLHLYPSLWLALQILEMTQLISWKTFPPTATSSGSLLLADMEKSRERQGREGGVSRLQVAARSIYGLKKRARSEMSSDCLIGNSPQEYITFVIIPNRFLFETVS